MKIYSCLSMLDRGSNGPTDDQLLSQPSWINNVTALKIRNSSYLSVLTINETEDSSQTATVLCNNITKLI